MTLVDLIRGLESLHRLYGNLDVRIASDEDGTEIYLLNDISVEEPDDDDKENVYLWPGGLPIARY